MTAHRPAQVPDGIMDGHERDSRWARLLPLALLSALLGMGLAGALGGAPGTLRQARTEAASLGVRTPDLLRSGMVFETIIDVTPHRPVADLAIGIPERLWREMTVNTMIPAADREDYRAGLHRFSFGPADAGETLRFKIDGQINPPLFAGASGEIVAFDGERKLAGVPVTVRILP